MNEIITYGQNYKLTPGIKVFVKSAKKVCENVTVISSNLSSELNLFLSSNGVKIVDAMELAKKHNVQNGISPYTLKVIFFYIYIKNYTLCDNVYLCDFTDLFFQKNPFDLIQNKNPYVTSENYYINMCETNSTWLNICYNNDVYNLLKKYEIINGGSILGNRDTTTELLKEMCADMSGIISRIGNYQNIDQASLNKTIYFDSYRYNIMNQMEIVNMAHHETARVNFSKINNFITINEKTPYVIHQYDINKKLENHLYESHK